MRSFSLDRISWTKVARLKLNILWMPLKRGRKTYWGVVKPPLSRHAYAYTAVHLGNAACQSVELKIASDKRNGWELHENYPASCNCSRSYLFLPSVWRKTKPISREKIRFKIFDRTTPWKNYFWLSWQLLKNVAFKIVDRDNNSMVR